jgi:hypothetical protein
MLLFKWAQKVMFETDCMVLMQAMLSDEYDLSTMGTLFKEVKFLLHVGLSDVSIVHCKRECNVAAHTLAWNCAIQSTPTDYSGS